MDVAAPRSIVRFRSALPDPSAASLPEWGDPDAPLVYVTFGSVAATMPFGPLFRSVLAALADMPIRVLLTTGHAGSPEELRPWPPNAHVETWWPQDEAMTEAVAVIGHGGFGTTMAALAAGVPQVVLPLFTGDQAINASRVDACRAGVRVDLGHDPAGQLRTALTRVLDDTAYRAGAQRLRDEIAELPPVSSVVHAIVAPAS
nr:nucleotide disphospho-sugar-binding domain-containing protein [Microbacterium thalassium]